MSKKEKDFLTYKDIYEEVGRNYRYFLNWRHALFVGYLVVLYTTIKFYAGSNSLVSQRFYLGGLLLISIVFWIIEIRIRDLYRACTEAGESLENGDKDEKDLLSDGIYARLNSPAMRNKFFLTLTH